VNRKPRFVVQEHRASILHWDLRLEHEGVAVSWAVPKGVPEEPGVNRLAVAVPDHPVSYMSWSGTIRRGYGKGTVKIWDEGAYELDEWSDDKIKVRFEGERLRGPYVLIHTSGKNWLVRKR